MTLARAQESTSDTSSSKESIQLPERGCLEQPDLSGVGDSPGDGSWSRDLSDCPLSGLRRVGSRVVLVNGLVTGSVSNALCRVANLDVTSSSRLSECQDILLDRSSVETSHLRVEIRLNAGSSLQSDRYQ